MRSRLGVVLWTVLAAVFVSGCQKEDSRLENIVLIEVEGLPTQLYEIKATGQDGTDVTVTLTPEVGATQSVMTCPDGTYRFTLETVGTTYFYGSGTARYDEDQSDLVVVSADLPSSTVRFSFGTAHFDVYLDDPRERTENFVQGAIRDLEGQTRGVFGATYDGPVKGLIDSVDVLLIADEHKFEFYFPARQRTFRLWDGSGWTDRIQIAGGERRDYEIRGGPPALLRLRVEAPGGPSGTLRATFFRASDQSGHSVYSQSQQVDPSSGTAEFTIWPTEPFQIATTWIPDGDGSPSHTRWFDAEERSRSTIFDLQPGQILELPYPVAEMDLTVDLTQIPNPTSVRIGLHELDSGDVLHYSVAPDSPAQRVISNLLPGRYILSAGENGPTHYPNQYFPDGSTGRSDSPVFELSAGGSGTATWIIDPGSQIFGTAKASNGEPLQGRVVFAALTLRPDPASPLVEVDSQGAFVISGLFPGDYRVGLLRPDGTAGFYPDMQEWEAGEVFEIRHRQEDVTGIDIVEP